MNGNITTGERRTYYLLIMACIAVYLTGWRFPLMEIDAAQYANISREMLLHKSFLQVYDQGQEYLDKPPMLFWFSTLSMYVFGINDMAYRLPSFFFAILSIYSTYRFVLLYYGERTALLSALVLASCQAMFLINHDVRTDTMLMGWVMLSVWQLTEWFRNKRWKHLIRASIAIAGGMLTKGPLALMIPVFVFVPHIILRRSFRDFFRWQYIVMILIIAVLLIPMSIGLYEQFDMHPEKTVNGLHNVSGLRFFYWTQSFGRITGENVWHENGSFFFLLQNILWSFLPWVLFFIAGLFFDTTQLIKKKFLLAANEEWISTGGFILTYCALASSQAQLPHYIFVAFPFAAVITAKFLYKLLYTDVLSKWRRPLFIAHAVIFCLLAIAVFMVLYFPFPPPNTLLIVTCAVCLGMIVLALVKKWLPVPALVTLLSAMIIWINIFMNTGFYPKLLQYQLSIKVCNIIKKEHYDKDKFFIYQIDAGRSLDFYSNHSFVSVKDTSHVKPNDILLTSADGLNMLDKTRYQLLYSGQSFHVSLLTFSFLNPATRYTQTTPFYILKHL